MQPVLYRLYREIIIHVVKNRPRLINNHIDPTFSFYELQTGQLTVNIREELSTKLINRPIICEILSSVNDKMGKETSTPDAQIVH